MQRVVLFISLLLLELHGSSTAANPGFRTAITTKGLDYGQFLRLSPMTDTTNVQLKLAGAVRCPELHSALFYCFSCPTACQVAVPILEKELLSLTIPDITGKADTPIGSVDYELKKRVILYIIASCSYSSPKNYDKAQSSLGGKPTNDISCLVTKAKCVTVCET